MAKSVVPSGHSYVRDNVIKNDSIISSIEKKHDWAEGIDLPEAAEYLFFAGCGYQTIKYAEALSDAAKGMEKIGIGMDKSIGMNKLFGKMGFDVAKIAGNVIAGSKNDSYKDILRKAVNILQVLGVDIGYLREEEPCCGSPLYYSGHINEYASIARKNIDLIKSKNIKSLISLIPACTSSWKVLYPKYAKTDGLKVLHFSEIVWERILRKGVKLCLKEKIRATYHDPCQLSRSLKITKEPRQILSSIEGLELLEPKEEQIKKWSTCCGGGGLEVGDTKLAERLGARRADELLQTGADMIVTHCPACVMQLKKSVKKLNSEVQVVDMIDILHSSIKA